MFNIVIFEIDSFSNHAQLHANLHIPYFLNVSFLLNQQELNECYQVHIQDHYAGKNQLSLLMELIDLSINYFLFHLLMNFHYSYHSNYEF